MFKWFDYNNNTWKNTPRHSNRNRNPNQNNNPIANNFGNVPNSILNHVDNYEELAQVDLTNTQNNAQNNAQNQPLTPKNAVKRKANEAPPNEPNSKGAMSQHSSPKEGVIPPQYDDCNGFGMEDGSDDENDLTVINQLEIPGPSQEQITKINTDNKVPLTKKKQINKLYSETVSLEIDIRRLALSDKDADKKERKTMATKLQLLKETLKEKMGLAEQASLSSRSAPARNAKSTGKK